MRIPMVSGNIHECKKFILKNKHSLHPSIRFETEYYGAEEYIGSYCLTPGSRLLLQHDVDGREELDITGKSDVKCVFHSIART